MGMLSLADILLTDAQVSYKENRIILYFKSDAEVNPIFKEHVRSLYAKFVKQESVSVTIGEHSFRIRGAVPAFDTLCSAVFSAI